jgi:hypothetical protein
MGQRFGRCVAIAALALITAGRAEAASKAPAPAKAESAAAEPAKVPAPAPAKGLVQAVPPPFSDGIFPCSQCHDGKTLVPNATRRQLDFHDEQQSVFAHDAEHRWCLDCHDLENRDVLHLTSGAPVPFTESYRLCGQCHGDKLRDWRVGVHGKRVGRWDGEKTYFLCVNCHNPHTPRWKGVAEVVADGKKTVAPTLQKLQPEPRPKRPEEQRQ